MNGDAEKPRHVIVADPDGEQRTRVRRVLERLTGEVGPLEIHEAESGDDVLALLERHPVRLMISEVVLDGWSGMKILRKIQGDEPAGKTGGLPVILVSTMTREIDRYWALRNGAHAYIPKPYDDSRLEDRIRKALAGAPKDSPARR